MESTDITHEILRSIQSSTRHDDLRRRADTLEQRVDELERPQG